MENARGAHLPNGSQGLPFEVTWWRERGYEDDYVVETPRRRFALEVKSGRPRRPRGLDLFRRRHPEAAALVVGGGGIPLEEFFTTDPRDLFGS